MSKLSTQSYKGVRDFYPEDEFVQRYIKDTWREVVERFGYEAYDASVIEPLALYESKSGQEIVNEQTYKFTDRGDREVTLRPEMTPTVARLVAGRRRELGFPLRLYSVPNLFRYERPQKGRLREHWQLNVDLFGVSGIEAEIEMIQVAVALLGEFGVEQDKYEIRVNDRALVNSTLSEFGLHETKKHALQKLLDKKEKISEDDFTAEMTVITEKELAYAPKINQTLQTLISSLGELGIRNVKFSPNLMRGFDYYTGVVFEVFSLDPENNRALFGGGRFDNLLEIFDQEPIPAVGFGMGDVTMRDVLEAYELTPQYQSATELCLLPFSEEQSTETTKLAQELRAQGLRVAVDYSGRKVGDMIKATVKRSTPFICVVGESELKSGSFMIKNLSTEEETKVKREAIARTVQEALI